MTALFHLLVELDPAPTPASFLAAFPERGTGAFVLRGAGGWSFMGAEPVATFRATRVASVDRPASGARARVDVDGSTTITTEPFAALRSFLRHHAAPASTFDPRVAFPFRAGAVGYLGYECGQLLERLPCLPRPSLGMPDIALGVHRWVIAAREREGQAWLSILEPGRDEAEQTKGRVTERLRGARAMVPSSLPAETQAPQVRPVLSREQYMDRVARAKAHIAAGDAFEVCLTNALRAPFPEERTRELWSELTRSNPAPFSALLDLPEGAVVSSSPERFLSLDASGRAESRPIKGTRPRGASPEADRILAAELATSEKDRAENAMIVDLVRNDLGRVCRPGSVVVPELYAVESYATVHQLVSTIRGDLEEGKDAIDLVTACFPPGSMTGAPKIEAMTILERLEPVERGVYAGALGWFDAAGALDLSVVIRTAVVRAGAATFSVGGAVVADSEPSAEHEEAEHKARALVAAIGAVAVDGGGPS